MEERNIEITSRRIPEFSSGSSTHVVTQERSKRQASKTLKQVQGLANRNTTGFTLVEMLVVVLIIAILAAIALPQYQKAVKRSTYAGMLPVLATVVEAQKLYYMTHGEYAQDMTKLDIGLPITGTCEGTFEISADVGYATKEYCLYLTNKVTNHTGILINLASNKFNLPADGWKVSGYEYLFSSTLGKRPAQATYCRERSFWEGNSPRLRKDFHCTGSLANYNNYGAWFKMD